MKPRSKGYRDLQLHEPTEEVYGYSGAKTKIWRSSLLVTLIALLILSVACNLYVTLLSTSISHFPDKSSTDVTPFARLTWDKWIPYEHGGLYNSDNENLTNEAWDAINYDSGSVALSDEYVAQMGLPPAQRFPWDDAKGLYFMNGQHQLHCVRILRRGFLELRDAEPLSLPWEHLMHCFNALRQEIICTADDTPRYTSPEHPAQIGVGQYRRCRNWDKMEAWSREHTSCWRNINSTQHIDPLLRYRYCPPGSPYAEKVHAVFGDFETQDKASAAP